MCGIVGYAGKENAVPYLLEGLHKLEYRGYDSAGVAVMDGGEIFTKKAKGRLCELEARLSHSPLPQANLGIGHTRWATHGAPTDENAHPHTSQTGLFCVVHNGIIENFDSLRKKLLADGFVFNSETDTEVIAHLFEQNYSGDVMSAVSKTVLALQGSFALAILCKDAPDMLICAKRSSPLVIGKSENGIFACSDITPMLKYTNEIYTLDDDELAVIENGEIRFFKNASEIKKKTETVTWKAEEAEKDGYEHFMLKEIMQQPGVIKNAVSSRIRDGKVCFENMALCEKELSQICRVYYVACGSAYHAGVCGKYVTERLTNLPCEAQIASEFRYNAPPLDERTLVVIISQSGETADTLAALRLAKEKGAKVLSVVNVVGSTIAKESDSVIYTHAGPEIAVATTKAYSAQLAVIYLIAIYLAQVKYLLSDEERGELLGQLLLLDEKVEYCLKKASRPKELAPLFRHEQHAYFIGRGFDYACAMEASLKMKEISYIHSEAYAAGELKHGTISLIEKGSVVVAVCCDDRLFKKTVSNIKEVKARGAYVICVTTMANSQHLSDMDDVIIVPDCMDIFSVSLSVIPMQLLSYYAAQLRSCDIDKPRNLAKSVTVE